MRLLKRKKSDPLLNTYIFSLEEFNPRNIPTNYAILSHRWGPDEVTFKDIQDGTVEIRAGYEKLEFCGRQAASDGLSYFWIDTCCIDKSNSVELSEAINSMFKWYQNASKCYVYLSDVPVKHLGADLPAEISWEVDFQHSKWFTRVWTLQELIAPTTVEFFSVEGRRLGDKKSLERQISEVTGISTEVLQGKPLSEVDERLRLSWTVKREATLEEDAAYSLLGIFDVHMPLIYGEGRLKALARLQREIRRPGQTDPYVTSDTVWIVPFEKNDLFTGRESQLAELEGRLFTRDHTSKIAITGLGGVGKTQLVLELLYRIRDKHKECSIIWIPATTMEDLQQGYRIAAQQLKIPGCEDQNLDIRKLVQDHLSNDHTGQWLLVYDNADNIDMWTKASTFIGKDPHELSGTSMGNSHRLIEYLPRSKQGCIIFTTRDKKAAVKLAQPNIVTVKEMSEDESTQLLKKSLGDSGLVEQTEALTALLVALTHLPLAITQAAAYIKANGVTLAEYRMLLEGKEDDAIEVLSEDFEDYGRYQNVKNPVATTWLISFEQIRRSDPLASEYLSFMACIDYRDIPESLLMPGPSRKRQLEAIGTLAAYAFISRRPLDLSLDLHRLVHLVTKNWLRREGSLPYWMRKTIDHLSDVFPESDHQNRALWRKYLPHTHRVLSSGLVGIDSVSKNLLTSKYLGSLIKDRRFNEAEAMICEILSRFDTSSIEERLNDLSSTSILLFMSHSYLDLIAESKGLAADGLETIKKPPGLDHPNIQKIVSCLAVAIRRSSYWQDAEQLGLQVPKKNRNVLALNHSIKPIRLKRLAMRYGAQGLWMEAEKLYSRVLESHRMQVGADDPITLNKLSDLATIYQAQDRLKEAEQLLLHVTESLRTVLGANHPDTLSSMNHLAEIYWKQGRLKEAENLYSKTLEGRRIQMGDTHTSTLASSFCLAAVHGAQGQWEEVEQLLVRSLEIYETEFGANDFITLGNMYALAVAWKLLGKTTQAIQMMREHIRRRSSTSSILDSIEPSILALKEILSKWEAESLNIDMVTNIEGDAT